MYIYACVYMCVYILGRLAGHVKTWLEYTGF